MSRSTHTGLPQDPPPGWFWIASSWQLALTITLPHHTSYPSTCFYFFCVVLGDKPWASQVWGKYSTTELPPSSSWSCLKNSSVDGSIVWWGVGRTCHLKLWAWFEGSCLLPDMFEKSWLRRTADIGCDMAMWSLKIFILSSSECFNALEAGYERVSTCLVRQIFSRHLVPNQV